VSGALAERVFAEKLGRAGFEDIWVGGHQPYGIEDAARYPLFTPELIDVMRTAIAPTARPMWPRA
jgi:arsenite methyltransferase